MLISDTSHPFIWETHGIHVGTGCDHVKHGIDDINKVVETAIALRHPNITFIIHSPRLTHLRYATEKNTNVKFIRGSTAYQEYATRIKQVREKYGEHIRIRYGVELEWMGHGIGMQWNRSKILQIPDADFVIGSVHFSHEGIAYDGSAEEAQELLKLRGSEENYWLLYIEEMIEMVDASSDMIHAVGHLDLPKLHIPIPAPLQDLDNSTHPLAIRMRLLLEMIAENNLALDVNVSGIKKGCGIYPDLSVLKRARILRIPLALGSDTHYIEEYGSSYAEGIAHARAAGYLQYVSFSRGIPEKRPFYYEEGDRTTYQALNVSIEMLNRRFPQSSSGRIPRFSFGGVFKRFIKLYDGTTSLGSHDVIRIRHEGKSLAIATEMPPIPTEKTAGLLALHQDLPGVISILFNTLASEGINVKTALLNSNQDGTASTFLTLADPQQRIFEAIEFIKGTTTDQFLSVELGDNLISPPQKTRTHYLWEIDGVSLPMPISRHMILAVLNNQPGVLLILLSALGSRGINIIDLQLGERGEKGYAALSVEGDFQEIDSLLSHLGAQYYEASHFELSAL